MMTSIKEQKDILEFVERASKCMKNNAGINTYTDSGHLDKGELFAIRWGLGNDCIYVFKIDESFEPINFQQALR